MIPYGKQTIDGDDIAAVVDVMKGDFLTTGPKVPEFEKAFAAKVGAKYATAVSSGTAALHLAFLATRVKKGSRFVTSPITFAASANCGLYCDAVPSFVDTDYDGLMDEHLLSDSLSEKIKVIIPVHYGGFPCDLADIALSAEACDSFVIEDACHALGSTYKGTKIGDCAFSDMACFSFHPVKHITTGEGGMVTTNSKPLDKFLKALRGHGIYKDKEDIGDKEPWWYEMRHLGYNYRMTDIQAAIGISQLKKLDAFVKRRKEIARAYDDAFKGYGSCSALPNDGSSAYHLYPILASFKKERRPVFEYLRKAGIGVQVHYIPVHLQPYYQNHFGFKRGDFPVAEGFYDREISIPMYPSLTDDQVHEVISKVKESFKQNT